MGKIFDLFGGKSKDGSKDRGKHDTAADPRSEVAHWLNFDTAEEGVRSLTTLLKEYWSGHVKDERVRTVCYGAQTIVGLLKVAIEAKRLQVEEDQLKLDREVHETVQKLLEQGDK